MKKQPGATGDTLKARCTKCRKVMVHTIVTMENSDPLRIKCTACSHEHNFKPRKPAAKPRSTTSRKKKVAPDPKIAQQEKWQILRPSMDEEKAVAYSMDESFKTKTLINHPVFGLGLVQRVNGAHKMEVLFEDGVKTMRCE